MATSTAQVHFDSKAVRFEAELSILYPEVSVRVEYIPQEHSFLADLGGQIVYTSAQGELRDAIKDVVSLKK